MDVPLEIWAAFATIVFGSVGVLETVGTRKINEKFKDLQAGESQRNAFVAEQLPKLIEQVNSSVKLIDAIMSKQDPQKTTELKSTMQKTVDLVEDIESVQGAQELILTSMRNVRDRGTYLIITSALVVLFGIASALYVPVLLGAFDILGVVYIYALAFLAVETIISPYREGRRIERFLKENHIYKIGGG